MCYFLSWKLVPSSSSSFPEALDLVLLYYCVCLCSSLFHRLTFIKAKSIYTMHPSCSSSTFHFPGYERSSYVSLGSLTLILTGQSGQPYAPSLLPWRTQDFLGVLSLSQFCLLADGSQLKHQKLNLSRFHGEDLHALNFIENSDI